MKTPLEIEYEKYIAKVFKEIILIFPEISYNVKLFITLYHILQKKSFRYCPDYLATEYEPNLIDAEFENFFGNKILEETIIENAILIHFKIPYEKFTIAHIHNYCKIIMNNNIFPLPTTYITVSMIQKTLDPIIQIAEFHTHANKLREFITICKNIVNYSINRIDIVSMDKHIKLIVPDWK
jgi:hypothetical protein